MEECFLDTFMRVAISGTYDPVAVQTAKLTLRRRIASSVERGMVENLVDIQETTKRLKKQQKQVKKLQDRARETQAEFEDRINEHEMAEMQREQDHETMLALLRKEVEAENLGDARLFGEVVTAESCQRLEDGFNQKNQRLSKKMVEFNRRVNEFRVQKQEFEEQKKKNKAFRMKMSKSIHAFQKETVALKRAFFNPQDHEDTIDLDSDGDTDEEEEVIVFSALPPPPPPLPEGFFSRIGSRFHN